MTDFDWNFYISLYDDVKESGINNEKDALNNWNIYGKYEHRICSEENADNFDYKYYTSRYSDIKNNITNVIELYKHWIYYGKNENRFPNKLIEDEYNNFKWIKYIKGKDIYNKKDAFYHWFNQKDKIYTHFNWLFYIKYYELNNINNENDAVKYYIKNYEKTPIINKNIYLDYIDFNWEKYILYYKLNKNNKENAFNYWINTGKYLGHIFFKINNLNKNIHKNIGIAVSVYSSNETPKERILCSKICLNSIINKCKNTMIIIVIDGQIEKSHYNFILELKKEHNNVKIYKNINNFGISKTKNICLKLLEKHNYDYLCLLDDDIEIKNDFTNYILNIFEYLDIPILSNYNDEMPYELIKNNNIYFILTQYYYGNFLVINKKYLKIHGYFKSFNYKWGEEHIEITKRYLNNSKYNNYAIYLGDYIINYQIINGKNTLHLHSINVDYNKAYINKIQMEYLLYDIKYVNFIFEENKIIDDHIISNKIKFNNVIKNINNIYMSNLIVTIMAAGEGKRMNSSIPKVLHLFKKLPMLVRIIQESFKLNPKKIIIITGKYDTLIKNTIKEYVSNDVYQTLFFVNQEVPNGTGGAIKCTLSEYSDDDNVLILNGDMPLIKSDLLEKIIENDSEFSSNISVTRLDNPSGYGRIIYDENKKFVGIREEKDCSEDEKNINIVNVGIYFFNSTILKNYIPLIDNNNIQNEYYLTDIIKIIRNESNIDINTYFIDDNLQYQIMGVNTQQELLDLENKY
jgi:CTP:molybdopterin cytidylyltransferase MocA